MILKLVINTRIESSDELEVNSAIEGAQQVFNSGVWSRAPAIARSKVLSRLARALEERIPELAKIETLQTGRTIREMNAQLSRLPEWLLVHMLRITGLQLTRVHWLQSDYYAALLRTHQAFVAPTQGQLLNYVQRVPLGVVAQITVNPTRPLLKRRLN